MINRDGGDIKAVTNGEFDDREPAWSHDGSRIAFSSDRYGGISTIWELALATGALRRVSDAAMARCRPGRRTTTRLRSSRRTRERAAGRTDRATALPGLWAVNAVGTPGAAASCRVRREAERHAVPARRGTPTAPTSRYSLAGGHLASTARTVSGADEDVFPFRPSWATRTEFVYTADGHIKRHSLDGTTSTIPFTATVPLQRSTFSIAHRALEPPGRSAERDRQARRSRRTAGRSRSPRWATSGCCRSAARRCS